MAVDVDRAGDAQVDATGGMVRRRWAWLVVVLICVAVWNPIAALGREPKKRGVELPGPSDVAPARRATEKSHGPADFRSAHFLLHTDLPPKEARKLLNRLEVMLALISKYWGQPLAGVIECYVVRNLDVWPDDALDPAGRAKIRQGAGITHTETLSQGRRLIAGKAVVYAVADGGTPQHEAVHAYCGQTFGRTGPLWYSEGMAEMGQYWRPGDASVHCPAYVVDYLRAGRPKRVRQILAEDGKARRNAPARTGDSWQEYAWRWALCHLLANNANYSDRFRALGLAYLNGAPASFATAYGPMMAELEFEYRFFLAHLDDGYRVDLCDWNWKRKFRQPAGADVIRSRIAAQRGWQPSGAIVESGQTYRYAVEGLWQIGPEGRDVTADGLADGSGRLEGVVFHDYELSEPFALSSEGTFAAPAFGRLFLRCGDRWNELADNTGFMVVRIKQADLGNRTDKQSDTVDVEPPGPADAE